MQGDEAKEGAGSGGARRGGSGQGMIWVAAGQDLERLSRHRPSSRLVVAAGQLEENSSRRVGIQAVGQLAYLG